MGETWAKGPAHVTRAELSGVDLHLDLSGTRVRAGLESALRDAVRAGRLRPGTRLPSSRALAADLGIARNTVAEVYSQLVAEGWLTARTGSGTSVAPRRAARTRRGGHGPARAGGAPLRPAGRGARPVGVPAPRLARDGPQGPRGRPRSPARLPGSARAAAAAGRPGRLPGPGAGCDRRSRAHRHLRGLRARPGRHQPRAALGGRGHPRGRGLRPPDPPRHRGRAGPAPAAAAGRRHGRRRRPGRRGGRGAADPGAPVPAGRDAASAAPPGGGRLGRRGDRGRL